MSSKGLALVALLLSGCQREPKIQADPAIDRAVRYFVARGAKVDPIALLFLDFLRRKHGLTRLDPVVAQLKNVPPHPAHPDRQLKLHLRTYARLADPAAMPSDEDLEAANAPLDRLGLEALYCDRNGAKSDLADRLRAIASSGKYFLTHAALYAGWALENGCLEAAPAQALLADLASQLAALVAAEREPTDLAMEAMAFMLYLGHGKQLRPDWIAQVRAAQREDGGWSHGPAGAPTNDHSSFLGLWVVLDSSFPGAPSRPWLR